MFSLLKKHPPSGNPGRMAKWAATQQRRAADYLNARTAHWSTKGKTAFLLLTALAFGVAIALILLNMPEKVPVSNIPARVILQFPPPESRPLLPPVKDSSDSNYSTLKTPLIQ